MRKTGLLTALLLGVALALSPAYAYAEYTGSTIYEVDPYPDGNGGGHSIGDEKSFGELIQEVWEYVSGEVSSAWDSFFGGDGFSGSEGGDFGGGGSSSSGGSGSSSSGSGDTTQTSNITYMTLNLVGSSDSSSNPSWAFKSYTDTGTSYDNIGGDKYEFQWSSITPYPRVTSIQARIRSDWANGINQWRSAGYDVIFILNTVTKNNNAWFWAYIVQSGGLYYDEVSKYYKIRAGYKYQYLTANVQRVGVMYDGSNVFANFNIINNPYNVSVNTRDTDQNITNIPTSNTKGYYVGVMYADGSTGTGGAPSGSGGDSGSSGDTYNTTNNYNTTTTYNNLDLDLSPITQRQDNALRTINQIGKDVNKLVYKLGEDIDNDIKRLFAAILSDVAVNRNNGLKLQSILDELTDGYLQDIAADIDLISKELTNLQSNESMQSVKGFLYTINDNIRDILQELESLPSGGSGGGSGGSVDVDLTAVTNELEDFHLDAISAWNEMVTRLDTIIDDIEHLNRWQPTTPKPEPPDDLEKALGVDALKDALARLMGKFPFSTINNLALILSALVRPAVAPVFDLPMPNPSDWSSPYMVHVDLSDWSQVAAMMRVGILLWAIGRVSRRTVNLWTREEGGGE